MNSIAVAKFIHIIYDTIFISLFGTSQIEGGLLGPISNYFGIVEINRHRILYLHYLI